MPTRREILKAAINGSALVALSPTVPAFLAHSARAAGPDRDGRVLVVIQLEGGNDAINTLVPFADEGYARNRKVLRMPEKGLIRVNDRVGSSSSASREWEICWNEATWRSCQASAIPTRIARTFRAWRSGRRRGSIPRSRMDRAGSVVASTTERELPRAPSLPAAPRSLSEKTLHPRLCGAGAARLRRSNESRT